MLRINVSDEPAALSLRLEGKLVGPWVAEVLRVWAGLQERTQGRVVTLDLKDVSFVDDEGRTLLLALYRDGCRLVGGHFADPLLQAIQYQPRKRNCNRRTAR